MKELNLSREYCDRLITEFEKHRDSIKAGQMSKYMRNQFDFYGINSPRRKLIVKDVFHDVKFDPILLKKIGELLWEKSERECQYAFLDMAHRFPKRLDSSFLPFIIDLIKTKSWWDTVDGLSTHYVGKIIQKENRETITKFARTLNSDEVMWVRRCSLIFQMTYKEKIDKILLRELISNVNHDREFFIQKAIGWILRQTAKHDVHGVLKIIEDLNIIGLAKREALKHHRNLL